VAYEWRFGYTAFLFGATVIIKHIEQLSLDAALYIYQQQQSISMKPMPIHGKMGGKVGEH
jgi:hypothetical protein